ncbi:hypothetical protein [uncultured Martelella sp.]|uniref:hypothetical protein n=1 Tax=uncultured Martelella sp. TaxID=392331 RepID=UPI0029C8EAD8|nr:hypothetical protein [uncultured Martelella sp.]
MSVHYDVETTVAQLRTALNERKAPGEHATKGTHVRFRNPEAIIAVQEMFMRELNRATPREDIIEAVIEMTVDHLTSLLGGNREALSALAEPFAVAFIDRMLTAAGGEGVRSKSYPMVFEHGGHA